MTDSSELELRWYQNEAVGAFMNYLDEYEGHPLIILPTGSGKTPVIGELVDQYLTEYPSMNIIILSNTQEILEQDYNYLKSLYSSFVGLYSAGLGKREKKKITVAGIQSVYKHKFENVSLIIIDEAHDIPVKGEGQYRTFLANHSNATYVGLTATGYRLGSGLLHEGEGRIFTDVVYNMCERDNYNKLVQQGFLSPILPKATEYQFDTEGLKVTAGDYNQKAMSDKFDRIKITNIAVKEIIKYGRNYKLWMIFAIDILHAEHIAKLLKENNINTALVHSKMKEDRREVIKKIKDNQYRAVVNVDMLTKGFDVPNIDLIALMCPTKSPVKHVQCMGRGGRIHPEKTHCLLLDFAGNVDRLGTIDDVQIRDKKKGDKKGQPIVKTCPECGVKCHPTVKICEVCDFKFQFKHGLNPNSDIKKKIIIEDMWMKVISIKYEVYKKKGSKDSLKVTYKGDLASFNEWICCEHKGFPGRIAGHWITKRLNGEKYPDTTNELFGIRNKLLVPKEILVGKEGQFFNIKGYIFD